MNEEDFRRRAEDIGRSAGVDRNRMLNAVKATASEGPTAAEFHTRIEAIGHAHVQPELVLASVKSAKPGWRESLLTRTRLGGYAATTAAGLAVTATLAVATVGIWHATHGSGAPATQNGSSHQSGPTAIANDSNPKSRSPGVAQQTPGAAAGTGGGTTASTPNPVAPAGSEPGAPSCTVNVSSLAAAESQAAAAPSGGVVCLAGGTYAGTLSLNMARPADVTIQPAAGAIVTVGAIDFGSAASHIHVAWLTSTGAVTLEASGASFITLSSSMAAGVIVNAGAHDITIENDLLKGGATGVDMISENCTTANAPYNCSQGNYQLPVISNVHILNNKMVGPFSSEAITASNFNNVDVEGNEISNSSTDVMRTDWGGTGLTFRKNYVHDVCGLGVYIKDGHVSNAVIDDNLFARTGNCSGSPPGFEIFDVQGLQLTHNTYAATSTDETLRAYNPNAPESTGIVMQYNVLNYFVVESENPAAWYHQAFFTENHNVIEDGWDWVGNGYQDATDSTHAPSYVNPAADDYRVSSAVSAGGATYSPGVDWRPADQHYGP